MYGLSSNDIEKIKSVFEKHQEIDKAILYGSRAKGNYREYSDIDISLIGNELNLSKLFEMEAELDDLLLPYKIDLSLFYSIENTDLLDHINRVGVDFFVKASI